MQQWTQNEAIAFECIHEAITDLMAIQNAEIYAESSKTIPDTDRLANLEVERFRPHQERSAVVTRPGRALFFSLTPLPRDFAMAGADFFLRWQFLF